MSPLLAAVVLGVFIAGLINGVTGLGFAIIVSAALALLLDAKMAVVMLAVMVPILSSFQLLRHRAEVRQVRRIAPLFVAALLGVPGGAYLLTILPVSAVALFLGILTLLYVATGFFELRVRVPSSREPFLSPLVGVTAGVCNGAIGVAGPLLAAYLLALNVPATTFVFSLALMFVAMSGLRLIGLISLQQLTPGVLGLSLMLVPPAVLGLLVGMWLQPRLPRRAFQRGVLVVLLVAGVNLVRRGLL